MGRGASLTMGVEERVKEMLQVAWGDGAGQTWRTKKLQAQYPQLGLSASVE